MKYVIFTLFVSMALAGPLSLGAASDNGMISACENAVNCEIYQDDEGKLDVRFKAGQEPGTDAYEKLHKSSKVKRDDPNYPQTHVTFAHEAQWWGYGIDIVGTLHTLTDMCHDTGSCVDSEPGSTTVDVMSPDMGRATTDTLTLTAEMREHIIEAVQASYRLDGITDTQTTQIGTPMGVPDEVTGTSLTDWTPCTISKAPKEVIIFLQSVPKAMTAWVSVTMKMERVENWFCKKGAPTAAAISSVLGPPGTGLSAVFGTIAVFC